MVLVQHGDQVGVMLAREHFGRCHHCSLITVQSGKEKREKCKNCLSGSHISLYKPGHDIIALHIAPDLVPHTVLRAGEFKGNFSEKPVNFRLVIKIEPVSRPVFILPVPSQSQNKYKKLFVHKTLSCLYIFLFAFRKMHFCDCLPVGKKSSG